MTELRIATSLNLAALRQSLEEAGAMPLVQDRPKSGDTHLIWDPGNEVEVKAARKMWDDLVGKHRWLAFRVGERGVKAEQIREFDPKAEKLIIAPPVAGGEDWLPEAAPAVIYPFADGDTMVLGPEIFASADGAVICWRGVNYVRQEV